MLVTMPLAMRRRVSRGLTLVELLIVMAIAAIAAAMSWPAYRHLRDEQMWQNVAGDFLATLAQARAEAMGRGVRVVVAPTDGRDWRSGWITFVDANLNNRPDPGEAVLMRRGPLPAGIMVESRQAFGGDLSFVAYAASGHSRTALWGWLSGSVDFIWQGRAQCVVVNAVGRPRLASLDSGDGACRPRTGDRAVNDGHETRQTEG